MYITEIYLELTFISKQKLARIVIYLFKTTTKENSLLHHPPPPPRKEISVLLWVHRRLWTALEVTFSFLALVY